MQQNLGDFIRKFVEEGSNSSFQHLYIVDKQTGPYRRIQDAINAAQPNSIIRVSEGFYEESLVINKPIHIEPKSLGKDQQKIGVILLIENGIGIHIKMDDSELECQIKGIKISHSGNSDDQLKQQLMEHQHIIDLFGEGSRQIQQIDHQYVNRISFQKLENMIIYVEKGRIKIDSCLLSLNYLVKSCSTVIPAVGIQKEGTMIFENSEIKGHPDKQTIGIVNKLGVLSIQNSAIIQHNEGGVLIWGVDNNQSRIFGNTFEHNSVGIHAVGQNLQMKIYSNNINNNRIGIKVGLACEVEISRNNIYQNDDGIQVNSAFPIIYLNKIENQKNNGIICKTYKKFICKAEIRKNMSIVGNKSNGIVIEGQNNRTKILQNYLIGFNGNSGIKVTKGASPSILLNKIYKNFKEGILITQNSWATIQKNNISHNIECNIALGGINSHHSFITENMITNSAGHGVILVESGRCHISRNDIKKNIDGINLTTSIPFLRRNYIQNNQNNGITCQNQSQPFIAENFISSNQSIGVFLRQSCSGTIHSNIIINNQISIGLQTEKKQFIKQITHSNTIQGNIDYPRSLGCILI